MTKSNNAPLRIFLVAGEPSGDVLAAELIEPLQARFGKKIEFAGVGGPAMAGQGIHSPIAMSQLSVLGYIEGIMAWWRITKLARETAQYAAAFEADIVVLVDSWGFSLRVAQALRKLRPETLLIKYVAPQVWASRPGRAKALAAAVDHLLTIHSFDAPYFEKAGLPVTFVGNAVLSRSKNKGDGKAFRKSLHMAEKTKVLLVLFGSRQAEFERLHEPFMHTVQQLCAAHPDLLVVAPLSAAIATRVRAAAADDPRLQNVVLLDEDSKENAFAAADVALACSGTITTELALAGVPMLIGYKIGPLSWFVLKNFFLRTPYVSLVNVAADAMIAPEFLQNDCQPANLLPVLNTFLDDEKARKAQQIELAKAVKIMGSNGPSAALRAAEAIHAVWSDR